MGKKQKTKNKKKIPFISKCKMHSFICSYSFKKRGKNAVETGEGEEIDQKSFCFEN